MNSVVQVDANSLAFKKVNQGGHVGLQSNIAEDSHQGLQLFSALVPGHAPS